MPATAITTARNTQNTPRQHSATSPTHASKLSRAEGCAAGFPQYLQRKSAANGAITSRTEPAFTHIAPSDGVPRYLQAKLNISQPGDAFEQEAEQVAAQVLRSSEPTSSRPYNGADLQVRRKVGGESARDSGHGLTPGITHTQRSVDSLQGSGHALPPATHQFFATRMGTDFSDVRIHHDTQAARLSADLHARALTYGTHIAFAAGQFNTDTSEGKRLLAHELTHVLQQRGQSGNQVQRDLALRPRAKPSGPGPTLSGEEQNAAVAYNKLRFNGMPDNVLRVTEDIVGSPRDTIVIDNIFVAAIARWQRWWSLQADGRMTPMTARAFSAELRAEAHNVRTWEPKSPLIQRLEDTAQYFDALGTAPFRDGATPTNLGTGSWTPPSGEDKLRQMISQDLQEDAGGAAQTWRDHAYIIRFSSALSADERAEYLSEIAVQLSGSNKTSEAMEVVSLIDVVSEGARAQMGRALSRMASNATLNETRARDYLQMLVRLAGFTSKDTPADPRAWLENNTEAVGQAIRAMETVLGSDVALALNDAVLKASFVKDPKYTVSPSGAGRITHLPKDAKAGNRLLADCDVYAVYGMRLLRAQGWETMGYFTFQGETEDDIAHAVGLARRKTANDKFEYMVVDSLTTAFFSVLKDVSDDEKAKAEADKRGEKIWNYHYYAPGVNGGAINPRLNTLHPTDLKYPP